MTTIQRAGTVKTVIEGKNNRLFLGEQEGFSAEFYSSAGAISDHVQAQWKATFKRRARELKRRGIPYVVLIAPDAHLICAEDLPSTFGVAVPSPGTSLVEAVSDLEGVLFVHPWKELHSAKGGLETYHKTESHWSQYGSYVAYAALCDAIAPLVDVTQIPARNVTFTLRKVFGDLGVQIEPERSEHAPVANVLGHHSEVVFANDGVGRSDVKEYRSDTAKPCRALFFRDSFMTNLAPYITRSFSASTLVGSTSALHLDLVDEQKPDIVISQLAERRLVGCDSDHQIDTYSDLYRADYLSALGRKALHAMLRFRAGEIDLAAQSISDFDSVSDLQADHAYVAAKIWLARREFARGYNLVQQALEARPDRPSYLTLAAQYKLGLGEKADAIRLAGAATSLHPFNAYYHRVYVYCLVQDGRSGEALDHLEGIIVELSDDSMLWYWASVLREAKGDRQSAIDAIHQAVIFHPGHPAFVSHAEKIGAR
jgi:hypothetical protein